MFSARSALEEKHAEGGTMLLLNEQMTPCSPLPAALLCTATENKDFIWCNTIQIYTINAATLWWQKWWACNTEAVCSTVSFLAFPISSLPKLFPAKKQLLVIKQKTLVGHKLRKLELYWVQTWQNGVAGQGPLTCCKIYFKTWCKHALSRRASLKTHQPSQELPWSLEKPITKPMRTMVS